MPLRPTAASILLLTLGGGCATILRGTEQTVAFRTVPPGAQVSIDDKSLATPADISLKRLKSYDVVISRPRFRTIQFKLSPEWDGVSLIGNLIMPGGSAGILVDTANGADRRFYELVDIQLVPATQPSEPPLVLKTFKGHLLDDRQYADALQADRNDKSQFFRGQP